MSKRVPMSRTDYMFFCNYTTQKMNLSIKDFFSKYDQICRKLQIWSHLLKKSLMENFIFCTRLCTIKRLFPKIYSDKNILAKQT